MAPQAAGIAQDGLGSGASRLQSVGGRIDQANSVSLIVAFGEAPPAKPESPRRSQMKRLQETIEAKPRPDLPRQLVIAFEAPQLWMMQAPER
jgi:hypothetical protein